MDKKAADGIHLPTLTASINALLGIGYSYILMYRRTILGDGMFPNVEMYNFPRKKTFPY